MDCLAHEANLFLQFQLNFCLYNFRFIFDGNVNERLLAKFFEMAAMPFPCNGLCFVVFNIPTVLLMFLIIWLVVLSLISIFFVFIADGLAFALSSFKMFLFLCHNSFLLAFFIKYKYTL